MGLKEQIYEHQSKLKSGYFCYHAALFDNSPFLPSYQFKILKIVIKRSRRCFYEKKDKLERVDRDSIISLVFLFLAFRKVEFRNIIEALGKVNYIYLLPTLISLILSYLFRVWRWKYILLPTKNIRFASLFSATMIGFMANNLLPGRIGEIIKVYFIGKQENISRSLTLATVVLERTFDVLIILIFLSCLLIAFPFPQWISKTGYLVTGSLGVISLVLFILKFKSTRSLWVSKKIFPFLPDKITIWILKLLQSFIDGLNILEKPKYLLCVILYSLLVWIISGMVIYYSLLAFNIYLPLYVSF